MPDYIPSGDAEFNTWVSNFVSYINSHLADFGLVANDMVAINALFATWNTTYPAVAPAQAALSATVEAKDTARENLSVAARALVRILQAKTTVTDPSKQAIQITVSDGGRTSVAAPPTAPLGRIESTNRFEHTLHFVDSSTPNSKAKPEGVRGCQIWVKIGGPAPTSASELRFLAVDTRSPYVSQFDGADAGKTAWYWLRWENTKGEPGPWSAPVSATIPG